LTILFNASESYSTVGSTPLTYSFNFSDGEYLEDVSSPIAIHTYTTNGTFTAYLVVTDDDGLVSEQMSVEIQAGNNPPIVAIEYPPTSFLFSVGQTITLVGNATDPELGGELPSIPKHKCH